MRQFILCFVLSVLMLSQVIADPTDPCENAMTTVELNNCAAKEYEVADKKLNSAYQELTALIKKQEEGAEWNAKLKTAQQLWIKFRDANCDYEIYISGGGSAATMEHYGCLTTMTDQRAKDLQEMVRRIKDTM